MDDPNFRLKILLTMELPFWLNLRIGNYPIESEGDIVYKLHIDCLKWEISSAYDPRNSSREEKFIQIQEDAQDRVIVNKESEQEIGKIFPEGDPVNFRKMSTVVSTVYYLCKDSEFNDNQIVDLINEKKEHLFLLINKFISAYMGYFSTKDFNHEAHLLSDEYLRKSEVRYRIELNDLDITNRIKVPQLFNPKYYPMLFPKSEQEKKFIELMKRGILPSFIRQSIGHANHFNKNGDWRMGILFLDIALESCISEFIKKYNQDVEDDKILEIWAKYTVEE